MPYVSRDESGNINGVYVNLQSDYGEEFLENDDPAVIAYLENTRLKIPSTKDDDG